MCWIGGGIAAFFHEAIKAWFFDHVVHAMKPYESAVFSHFIEYALPLLLILAGALVFVHRDRRTAASSFGEAAAKIYPANSQVTPWWKREWLWLRGQRQAQPQPLAPEAQPESEYMSLMEAATALYDYAQAHPENEDLVFLLGFAETAILNRPQESADILDYFGSYIVQEKCVPLRARRPPGTGVRDIPVIEVRRYVVSDGCQHLRDKINNNVVFIDLTIRSADLRSMIRTRFENDTPTTEQRVPFITVLKKAWETPLPESIQQNTWFHHLMADVRQAGLDGELEFWGRRNLSMKSQTEPLAKIPPQHWADFEVDAGGVLILGPVHVTLGDDNSAIRTKHAHRARSAEGMGFMDLHVLSAQSTKWLSEWAARFH